MKRAARRKLRIRADDGNGSANGGKGNGNGWSAQQLAVIVGLLTKALSVDSVMIDKDQNIEIVLGGSLRKKTKMDRLLDEMSDLSIGDLLDSINNR